MINLFKRYGLACVVGLALLAGGAGVRHLLEAPPGITLTRSVPADARQVNVLAIGDWGDDTRAEITVARGMARFARELPDTLDAVLSLGDNFYVPLPGGVDDPAWKRLFEDMYDRRALDAPFYVLLGNHDYSGGREDLVELAYAEQKPESRWKLPNRWYAFELPARGKPLVKFIMLDSNYLFLDEEQWKQQDQWLRAELDKPRTTPWLVVSAHAPLYCNSGHGDNARLISEWQELLVGHGVDFYLAGHAHNLEHLQIPGVPITFVVSGGGGAYTHEIERFDRGPFAREMHGFAHLRFGESSADVHLLDAHGKPVYAFTTRPRSPPQVVGAHHD